MNHSDLPHWMNKIRLIVLDLDGTLYHDPDFIPRYMTYLVRGTDHRSSMDMLVREAVDILEGHHAVKLGMFYDALNDVVIRHDGRNITDLYSWEGKLLKQFPENEGDVITSLHKNHIYYVGDEWGVTTVLSRRMGLTDEQRQAAFMAVREDMISTNGFKPNERLVQALQKLQFPPFRKVLITNSPASTGFAFVRYLGLDGLFDSYIFDGGKPKTLPEHLQAWISTERLSFEEIVSIGDNAWNDLYPIKQLGGQTVWVSRYQSIDPTSWNLQVRSMDELAAMLETVVLSKH